MYSKEKYKSEILAVLEKQGYNPVLVAQITFRIFVKHQREIDYYFRDKLLDIANMENGYEYEMSETEFKEFIEKM